MTKQTTIVVIGALRVNYMQSACIVRYIIVIHNNSIVPSPLITEQKLKYCKNSELANVTIYDLQTSEEQDYTR